ncbi:hypothetical protein [Paenibacillus macerans]|uniref:hypothetical protein n=1 Tax=Paenibacillus macerans TaxID=44252 RepID=UPI003D31411F
MKNPPADKKPILEAVKRIIALETELTLFNNERLLTLPEPRLTVSRTGGATLLMDVQSPQSSYYNRVIGFGPAELDRLQDILTSYGAEGIVPCFDMSPDRQSSEVAGALAAQGFVPRLQLAYLQIELAANDAFGAFGRPAWGPCLFAAKRVTWPTISPSRTTGDAALKRR